MIRSLTISNFRSFSRFSLEGLGRVNLLVGTNNSGKTSLLEAIELLLAHGEPRSIWTAMNRRGERIWEEEDRRNALEIDICRLFQGYSIELGQSFEIRSSNDGNDQLLRAEMLESDAIQEELPLEQESLFSSSVFSLAWHGGGQKDQTRLPVTDRGGVSYDALRRRPIRRDEPREAVSFVTTASLSAEELASLLSRVILNPEEQLLLNALRIIDPAIERIAPIASMRSQTFGPTTTRGGVVVKRRGEEKRVPIGTMGDGIWRLLALALSLVRAAGGVLLVDEIDTGLHYSVMERMWTLVYETAARLNIQVFATTHSSDCWKALSSISRADSYSLGHATIQRIEQGRDCSVAFSEPEIVMAAEGNIEVR